MRSLLLLSLLAVASATNTICLTKFGRPHRGHIPTTTSTVTITHRYETPWKREVTDSCALSTAIATSVSTVYTGTWNRNATHTILSSTGLQSIQPSTGLTISPSTGRTVSPSAGLQKRAHNGYFRHHVGQGIDHMMPNAYMVECIVMQTKSMLQTRAISATAVSTAPASSCSPQPFTQTSITTQDIRCAPTNLVSTVSPGRAIGSVEFWNPSLVYLESASDCCQLCMQLDGCSSVQAATEAKNCWLIFGKTRCGTGEIVHQDHDPDARVGRVLVQEGCGKIEYTTDP